MNSLRKTVVWFSSLSDSNHMIAMGPYLYALGEIVAVLVVCDDVSVLEE